MPPLLGFRHRLTAPGAGELGEAGHCDLGQGASPVAFLGGDFVVADLRSTAEIWVCRLVRSFDWPRGTMRAAG